MATNLQLNFGNLPLVEATIRVSLASPRSLSYSLVTSIGETLKPSFPTLSEPKQIEVPPGMDLGPIEFGPGCLPGAVYAGKQSGLSISVYPQVIVVRWVKHPGPPASEYPRYAALRAAVWEAVGAFRVACDDDFPGVAVVNMSYVNFVPVSDQASVLRTYFSDDVQLQAMAGAHRIRKLEASWSDRDDLDLRFALEQATARLSERPVEGYRITTAGGIKLPETLDAQSGLDKVHHALQKLFVRLISDQAKSEWKLEK